MSGEVTTLTKSELKAYEKSVFLIRFQHKSFEALACEAWIMRCKEMCLQKELYEMLAQMRDVDKKYSMITELSIGV
jgi:hypothetical protein